MLFTRLSGLQHALNLIVFQTLLQSIECATTCSHVYVSGKNTNGTFSSPGFPNNYPNNIVCHYVFQGNSDERIRLTFKEFHLENGTGHGGCNKDYVDYFTINMNNQKDLVKRLCGRETPSAVVSEHQRVEIVFKSDYLENHKGFLGIYEFVDERPYEAGIQCTWMIRVERDKMIILNFMELDLGTRVTCSHTHVSWYEGFGSPFREPLDKKCGQLYFYGKETGFTISSHRAVVRFISGADGTSTASSPNRRFRLSWTAVQMPKIDISGRIIGNICRAV
ncbi:hypothetical protein CAPTEDRAFT_202240 [Capitella teleta]|uniref:CUB domain-containing protein n=1 Tax=Capitella teleta TaxID=283909 RepID=R7UT11_CAPTE|nr:hypothetical protein CAPTEDRAFT_202240 [Capitella teleta]|eukprot:ELU09629.1 hypothetical protein CAPTEDRAFT_202240 [Capitella teleta]